MGEGEATQSQRVRAIASGCDTPICYAVPELLKLLFIKGCIVTVDALNCQKDIARTVIERQADYVFALKANHPQLHREAFGEEASRVRLGQAPENFAVIRGTLPPTSSSAIRTSKA